jgi:hypothetical protein
MDANKVGLGSAPEAHPPLAENPSPATGSKKNPYHIKTVGIFFSNKE